MFGPKVKLTKIIFSTSVCGHRADGTPFAIQPGAPCDWPSDEAERYVAKGMAQLCSPALAEKFAALRDEDLIRKAALSGSAS